MTLFEAIILGLVQGITAFFPVSSSGHLILFQHLLGKEEPMLTFNLFLHFGTLGACLFYFRKDFFQMFRQSVLFLLGLPKTHDRESLFRKYPYALAASFLILSCLATAIMALVFKEAFEALFGSLTAVGISWIGIGLVLIASRHFQDGDRGFDMMNHRDAFIVGLAQGVSIIPGVSRSGATILAGMLCGIEKKEAVRFSLWLSVPAIIGAGLLELQGKVDFLANDPLVLTSGLMASGIAGYLTIGLLLKLAEQGKIFLFGFYCLVMGLFTVAYFSVLPLIRS